MGRAQQTVRIGLGIGAAVLAYSFLSGWIALLVGVSALTFVLTGLIGYCPACAVAGLHDRSKP
ncbi:YgaP family membrane protein [Ensifer sp. KUDG1]|uniref:YgaP family membrane protein n=1 Tax=Ensifer sp. KUDG1 TaxID=3373919 RepID=UPI003D1AFA0D